jgi:hypothetical protein
MADSCEGSELVSDRNAEPQRDDTHHEQEPNQPSIGLVLATFLGGSGLAGIFGYIARIVDNPWSTCANGAAIICLIITLGAAVCGLYPRIEGFVIGVGMLVGVGAIVVTANKAENVWQAQDVQIKAPSPIPAPAASVALEQPTFHEKSEMVTFSLGGFSEIRSVSDLKTRDSPFDINGFSPVAIYLVEDKLFVDFTTWNGPDRPSVEVKGNEFQIRPEGWDHNSSTNALEVVNTQGQPVFQLIRNSATDVVINGLFLFPNGVLWAANYPETVMNPSPDKIAQFLPSPIFKYPSWKYPGKYADNSN